jgi:DNA invertase Pin-like site-specific DNA recombinase
MSAIDRGGFFVLHRVSTRQQEEKFGLDWQRTNLRPYGEKWLGPTLGVYDEGATSTSLDLSRRPTLLGLLADLDELRPAYLLVADMDRLARGDDFVLIKSELRKHGVKLAYFRDGASPEIIDLADEYGDFMSDIQGAVAKLEKRKIVKRMRRGKQKAARQGNAVQPVPYGFIKPSKGTVAICPERAPVVEMIFEQIVSGSSIRKMVQRLNQTGVPSPRGKVGGWTISYVAKMMRNPAYVGRAEMLGEVVAFPRLIDDETFRAIPDALERNKTFAKRNNTRFEYLCKSMVFCARCGRAVCGTPRHGKPAYTCNGRTHDKSKGVESPCDQPTVYAGPVDELVWQAVSQLALNPTVIREYARAAPTVIAAELTFLRKKQKRFDERRQAVLRQHEMGIIGDDDLGARISEIERERSSDESRLAELGAEVAAPEVDLSRLENAERLCRELAPRLVDATFDEQRAIVEALVSRVALDGKQVTVELIAPLVREAVNGASRRSDRKTA